MKNINIIHFLRVTASFSLLGAVVCGSFFGWQDYGFDVRAIGASIGGIFAVIAQLKGYI